jgi:hypothetical protein
MLDHAQRQDDMLLEQHTLAMEYVDHIEKMRQQHHRLHQMLRSNKELTAGTSVVAVSAAVVEASTASPQDLAEFPGIDRLDNFRIPNALKNGPIRGDR